MQESEEEDAPPGGGGGGGRGGRGGGGMELGAYGGGAAERRAEEAESMAEASGSLSAPWTPSSHTPSSSAAMSTTGELPRKRKGKAGSYLHRSLDYNMEEDLSRSEESEDQQVKLKCFREPHRQIEKRRRDKMNNLIDELAAMLPTCNPVSRKPDKLSVLRTAVQYLKTLKAGTTGTFTDSKPSFLPEDDLRHIVLRAAEGFLLVVTCDRGKIIFISDSVSKILNYSRLELTGQSLFHVLHPKDVTKVKEQLSASEFPRERLVDAATGAKVPEDSPAVSVSGAYLSTGARRSFFCRMKQCRTSTGNLGDKSLLPGASKKKDSYRYCTVHCTGYMRSWPASRMATAARTRGEEGESDVEKDGDGAGGGSGGGGGRLTCLVTVCRVHPHSSSTTTTTTHRLPSPPLPPPPPPPGDEVAVKPAEFVTRCTIDGKFTFVDQQATVIIGYLPQELLGTSCYEYFHHNDLGHLAERHRQVLRSKEKIETNCYRFKTKYGPYVSLQSQWFSFANPWTKEVEFIVSRNRVISELSPTKEEEEAGGSKALHEDSKRLLPIIPGLSSGAGTMIYAGSIGTQIANELIDANRMSLSPPSGAASPLGPAPDHSPLVSRRSSSGHSGSSRQHTPGSSEEPSDEGTSLMLSAHKTPAETADPSPLDLDSLVVPDLSSFSSDEAAMSVIMSLLEADTGIGSAVDFEDIHWS